MWTPPLARMESALLLEQRRATAVTGTRRRANQSAKIATAGSHPAIRRVPSISARDQYVATAARLGETRSASPAAGERHRRADGCGTATTLPATRARATLHPDGTEAASGSDHDTPIRAQGSSSCAANRLSTVSPSSRARLSATVTLG